ncbi:MAG TPA: hypothetical protein VN706_11575 [Gemmatimonadaceae bacterium]|nr:hypothetical protein [Gemmatimonadaceae bacterium]
MEERVEGILLRPRGHVDAKLSWADTARDMAANAEDWSAWDAVASDGLDDLPWDARGTKRVAEDSAEHHAPVAGRRPRKKKRT